MITKKADTTPSYNRNNATYKRPQQVRKLNPTARRLHELANRFGNWLYDLTDLDKNAPGMWKTQQDGTRTYYPTVLDIAAAKDARKMQSIHKHYMSDQVSPEQQTQYIKRLRDNSHISTALKHLDDATWDKLIKGDPKTRAWLAKQMIITPGDWLANKGLYQQAVKGTLQNAKLIDQNHRQLGHQTARHANVFKGMRDATTITRVPWMFAEHLMGVDPKTWQDWTRSALQNGQISSAQAMSYYVPGLAVGALGDAMAGGMALQFLKAAPAAAATQKAMDATRLALQGNGVKNTVFNVANAVKAAPQLFRDWYQASRWVRYPTNFLIGQFGAPLAGKVANPHILQTSRRLLPKAWRVAQTVTPTGGVILEPAQGAVKGALRNLGNKALQKVPAYLKAVGANVAYQTGMTFAANGTQYLANQMGLQGDFSKWLAGYIRANGMKGLGAMRNGKHIADMLYGGGGTSGLATGMNVVMSAISPIVPGHDLVMGQASAQNLSPQQVAANALRNDKTTPQAYDQRIAQLSVAKKIGEAQQYRDNFYNTITAYVNNALKSKTITQNVADRLAGKNVKLTPEEEKQLDATVAELKSLYQRGIETKRQQFTHATNAYAAARDERQAMRANLTASQLVPAIQSWMRKNDLSSAMKPVGQTAGAGLGFGNGVYRDVVKRIPVVGPVLAAADMVGGQGLFGASLLTTAIDNWLNKSDTPLAKEPYIQVPMNVASSYQAWNDKLLDPRNWSKPIGNSAAHPKTIFEQKIDELLNPVGQFIDNWQIVRQAIDTPKLAPLKQFIIQQQDSKALIQALTTLHDKQTGATSDTSKGPQAASAQRHGMLGALTPEQRAKLPEIAKQINSQATDYDKDIRAQRIANSIYAAENVNSIDDLITVASTIQSDKQLLTAADPYAKARLIYHLIDIGSTPQGMKKLNLKQPLSKMLHDWNKLQQWAYKLGMEPQTLYRIISIFK